MWQPPGSWLPPEPRRRAAGILLLPLLASCTVVGYPSTTPPAPAVAVAGAPRTAAPPAGSTDAVVASDPAPAADAAGDAARADSYEVFGRRYRVLDSADGYRQVGLASWYGGEFAGRPTSSGEIFDPDGLTAAHRTLPLETWVEVTNLANGRRIVVRVNDRGPFADPERRIIDLSHGAAKALGMVGAGVVRVEVRALAGPPAGEGG